MSHCVLKPAYGSSQKCSHSRLGGLALVIAFSGNVVTATALRDVQSDGLMFTVGSTEASVSTVILSRGFW